MKRFNYLAAREHRPVRRRIPVIAIERRALGPFALLLVVVLASAALVGVEAARLRAIQLTLAHTRADVARTQQAADAVTAVRAQVEQRTRILIAIDVLRRADIAQANALATIGNRLPPGTFVRSLRYENGSYVLDGTADRVAAIGTAIDALRDRTTGIAPRLISLHEDSADGAPRVTYTLAVEPGP